MLASYVNRRKRGKLHVVARLLVVNETSCVVVPEQTTIPQRRALHVPRITSTNEKTDKAKMLDLAFTPSVEGPEFNMVHPARCDAQLVVV